MKMRIEVMLIDLEKFFKYWLMYTVALAVWIISIIMIATIILIPLWQTLRQISEWFEKPIVKAEDVALEWFAKK